MILLFTLYCIYFSFAYLLLCIFPISVCFFSSSSGYSRKWFSVLPILHVFFVNLLDILVVICIVLHPILYIHHPQCKKKRLNFFNLMCSSLKVGVYILIILRGKGMGMLYNNRGYYVCATRIDDRVHSIGSGGGGAGCL